MSDAYIVGVDMIKFGRFPEKTVPQLGAEAAFAGKSFLWSLGALGDRGPAHLIDVYIDDICATMGQLGCRNIEELRGVITRHPGAYSEADFTPAQ